MKEGVPDLEHNQNLSVVFSEVFKETYGFPKTTIACAPTPAAPIVWATVFKLKIAARGLSISFFKLLRSDPNLGYLFSNAATKLGVTESRTDSKMEQRNETPKAKNKKKSNKVMILQEI